MTGNWIEVRVAQKQREAEGVFSFRLVPTARNELPAFEASAHVDVRLPNGLTRQYSLCNNPNETECYIIAVQREVSGRGGSACMCDSVAEGSLLTISAPRNNFPLVVSARRSLLFAGGIGVTPILTMAEVLWDRQAEFVLHYGARNRARMVFAQRLAAAPYAGRVALHFDDEPETRLDLAAAIGAAQANTHIYVCGPKGFIDAVLGTARQAGWPEAQLHFELFTAEVEQRTDDGSFCVELARSGRRVMVESGQTVAQALEAAGVPVEVSCEQGICGTCVTRVISGEPDHRDLFLTPEDHARNDQFTPCCSRSKTPVLVIDR